MTSPVATFSMLGVSLYAWVFRVTIVIFALGFATGLIGMLRQPGGLRASPEDIGRDIWPLVQQGRREEALLLARKISRMMPNAMAHEIIGTLCLELEDYECAEENLRAAIKLDAGRAEPLGKLALTLTKTGRREEGEEWLKLALARAPESRSVRRDFASVLELTGRTDEALSTFEDLVRENPEDADSRTLRANLLLDAGRAQEAEQEFRRALKTNPLHFAALNDLGALVAGQSRFEEALLLFEEAHKLNPSDENVHLNYALILLDLGRKEQARQEFMNLRNQTRDTALMSEIDKILEAMPRQP